MVPSHPVMYRKTLASTVKVESAESIGSGVVINDHCIVTVRHVAEDATPQVITTQDGKDHLVTKKYLGEFSDMAVECVKDSLNAPAIHISRTMPELYSPVFVLGNPLGQDNTLTTGNYQGGDRITAPVVWGNSGGGVFDESGNLIGVAATIMIKAIGGFPFAFPHLAGMTTIRDIIPFLDANHITYSPALTYSPPQG